MTAKAKTAQSWIEELPKRVQAWQTRAEKRTRKGYEQAVDMLPPVPRKAIKRWVAAVDRARHNLEKRSDRVIARARKRSEEMGAQIERRVDDAIKPIIRRLDVPTRADVERLRRRLDQVERRLAHPAPHAPA